MNKTVLIRADGSKKIGMGHLSRAKLISNYLFEKHGFRSLLLVKKEASAELFLKSMSISLKIIPPEINSINEAELIKKYIKENGVSLFILDVLENDLDFNYTNEIRNTGIPIAAITDDSYKRIINADVIINGNPCQTAVDYKNEKDRYFVGSSYFVMDERYSKKNSKLLETNIKDILLTVGGSDHNDIVFKILDAINRIDKQFTITLVSSKGTGYLERLKLYIKRLKVQVNLLVDIPGIQHEMINCDFAITAGGNSLFERIAARKPGVTICQLQRQMEIADKFTELGVNYNLGYGPEMTVEDIFIKLDNYLKKKEHHLIQYEKASEYVDGKGLSRVSEIFLNLIKDKNGIL